MNTDYRAQAADAEKAAADLIALPPLPATSPENAAINAFVQANLRTWACYRRVLLEAADLQQQVADLRIDLAIARGEVIVPEITRASLKDTP